MPSRLRPKQFILIFTIPASPGQPRKDASGQELAPSPAAARREAASSDPVQEWYWADKRVVTDPIPVDNEEKRSDTISPAKSGTGRMKGWSQTQDLLTTK